MGFASCTRGDKPIEHVAKGWARGCGVDIFASGSEFSVRSTTAGLVQVAYRAGSTISNAGSSAEKWGNVPAGPYLYKNARSIGLSQGNTLIIV